MLGFFLLLGAYAPAQDLFKITFHKSSSRAFRAGRKVGMTPSQHGPLIPWATHVLQCMRQRDAISQDGANPYKLMPSSDRSLQLDSLKPESLVIAGQLYRGEYVLKSCTRVAMRSGTLVGAYLFRNPTEVINSASKRNHSLLSVRTID